MVTNSSNIAVFIIGMIICSIFAAIIILPIYNPPTHEMMGLIDKVEKGQKESMKELTKLVGEEFEATQALIKNGINETIRNRDEIVNSKHEILDAIQLNRVIGVILFCVVLGAIVLALTLAQFLVKKHTKTDKMLKDDGSNF